MFKYKKFDILKRESPLVVFVGGSRQFSLEQPEPEIEREWQKTSTSLALRNQRPHPAWTNSLSSSWCVPASCNLPSLFLHKLNEMVLNVIFVHKSNIFFSFGLHCCFYVRQKVMICQWNIINEGNMCLGLLWWTIWGLRPGQETLLDEQQSVKRYHLNNLTIWEGICCFVSLKLNVTTISMMLQKHTLQCQHVIQYLSTIASKETFDANFSNINVFKEPSSSHSQWSIGTCKSRQLEIIILRIEPLN